MADRPFRRLLLMTLVVCLGWVTGATSPCHAQPDSAAPLVYRLELYDTIQPVSAWRLDHALDQAARDHAAALLIELDTPGGMLDSTRGMVGRILGSPVPVIVYIAPAGARGGSAGFFLLEAADIAAMAPGTNAGAAHPVMEGATPDETMRQKMENDAAAFLRSYTGPRKRNPTVAEEAVRESKAFSADEALAAGLIDVKAGNDDELLAALDGKVITRMDGRTMTLHLGGARVVPIATSVRDELLSHLANPNLALLLLAAGALMVYLEFNTPGTIIPGALGTVLILVAVFALNLLPIRHTAVALLAGAVLLLALELKFATHGILGVAALLCLTVGTLTLVAAPIPEMRVSPALAITLSLTLGVLTLVLLRLALRARRRKFLLGTAALVGHTATTLEPIGPEPPYGRVLVQGEIWEAFSATPIPADTETRVTGTNKNTLEVSAA